MMRTHLRITRSCASPGSAHHVVMPRTTINLSDERYRALKQAAARRGQTITEIVDEALERAGVTTRESVAQMLADARRRSGLTAEEATRLAIAETRADRAERFAQAARDGSAVRGEPGKPRS